MLVSGGRGGGVDDDALACDQRLEREELVGPGGGQFKAHEVDARRVKLSVELAEVGPEVARVGGGAGPRDLQGVRALIGGAQRVVAAGAAGVVLGRRAGQADLDVVVVAGGVSRHAWAGDHGEVEVKRPGDGPVLRLDHDIIRGPGCGPKAQLVVLSTEAKGRVGVVGVQLVAGAHAQLCHEVDLCLTARLEFHLRVLVERDPEDVLRAVLACVGARGGDEVGQIDGVAAVGVRALGHLEGAQVADTLAGVKALPLKVTILSDAPLICGLVCVLFLVCLDVGLIGGVVGEVGGDVWPRHRRRELFTFFVASAAPKRAEEGGDQERRQGA